MPRSGQKLTAIRLTRNKLAVLQDTDEEEHCRENPNRIKNRREENERNKTHSRCAVLQQRGCACDGFSSRQRRRRKAETDVDDLRKRGMGLTEAMEYYRGWIYDIVKVHISQDWECISGMEETLAIVEERVKTFF